MAREQHRERHPIMWRPTRSIWRPPTYCFSQKPIKRRDKLIVDNLICLVSRAWQLPLSPLAQTLPSKIDIRDRGRIMRPFRHFLPVSGGTNSCKIPQTMRKPLARPAPIKICQKRLFPKLLIYGVFQKGRVLAQDGVLPQASAGGCHVTRSRARV